MGAGLVGAVVDGQQEQKKAEEAGDEIASLMVPLKANKNNYCHHLEIYGSICGL